MTTQTEALKLADALNELLESFEKDGKFCKSSSIRNELYDRLKQTLEESKEALAQPEHDIDELCAKHNKIGYKHGYRAGKADEREKQSKASLSQPLVGTLLYLFREWKEDHLSQHNYIEAIEAIMDAHGIKE